MTVHELIKELQAWPHQYDDVVCSVDCDTWRDDIGRRVFGKDFFEINATCKSEAVLCFDLESINFKVKGG